MDRTVTFEGECTCMFELYNYYHLYLILAHKYIAVVLFKNFISNTLLTKTHFKGEKKFSLDFTEISKYFKSISGLYLAPFLFQLR